MATAFVAWSVVWGMPLLFLVSGQAVWFSLRSRSPRQFLAERFRRLLMPFLFGLPLLVPPQLYCLLRSNPAYHESYGEFFLRFFRVVFRFDFPWFVAPHPDTMLFEAAHLYFLYYLFAFSVLALPFLLYLKRETGQRLVQRLANFCQRPGVILLLGLPIGVIEATLQSENYGGWNRYVFVVFLVYGYILASKTELVEAVRKQTLPAALLAVSATVFGFAVYARAAQAGEYLGNGYALGNVLWRGLKGIGAWLWVVAFVGLSGKCLESTSRRLATAGGGESLAGRALRYASEAALPFYMLHQTIVVAVGFYVVQWRATVPVKYGAIALVSLGLTWALYELLVRRIPLLRVLFGMRPSRPSKPDGVSQQVVT